MVGRKAKTLRGSDYNRHDYDVVLQHSYDMGVEAGVDKGREEGRKKGKAEGTADAAKKMLASGMSRE